MARSRIGSRILPRWWILVGGDALDPPLQGQPGNEAQRPDEREAGTFPDLAWPILRERTGRLSGGNSRRIHQTCRDDRGEFEACEIWGARGAALGDFWGAR